MPKVIMPKLTPHTPQCTVLCWIKQPGDSVRQGEVLVELAVEKAVYTLECSQAGVLKKIYAPAGAVLPQGEPLGWISDKEDEAVPSLNPRILDWDDSIAAAPLSFKPAKKPDSATADSVLIPNNRLHPADENRRLQYSKKLYGQLRRTTRSRMQTSWQQTPKVDLFCDVDCSQLAEKRQSLSTSETETLSYNTCTAWAVARAFEKLPQYNLQWEGDNLIHRSQVDIGLAVALKDELITVRLANILKMEVMEIHRQFRRLIRKALRMNLTAQEQFGSSLTITNLGDLGVRHFTAIINPPEVFILSVGKLEERVVARNGQARVSLMATLCLSFDHRAINGVPAARLLHEIQSHLENPTF